MSDVNPNSTDATRGRSLRARIEARKGELETAVARLPQGDHARLDIERALSQIQDLFTGDLDHLPHTTAAQLNKWLEVNKHLDERHPAE